MERKADGHGEASLGIKVTRADGGIEYHGKQPDEFDPTRPGGILRGIWDGLIVGLARGIGLRNW